jgi:hypothetical protein
MSLTATILAFVGVAVRARPAREPDLEAEVARLLIENERAAGRIMRLEVALCDAQNRRDAAEVALEQERARQAQERRWEAERLMTQAHFAQAQQEALAGLQQNGLYQVMQQEGMLQNQSLLGAQNLGLGEAWCNCVPSRASLLLRGR